ncbi:hypothetical protein DPM19_20690 [Actinomadura craniellae]|uniref:Uncharacterized protein n=1 Tax=Actinomadura craniellae TaxID=2231787 RepID=A0A365H372_9ACTN|nr:hypothetical protein [Actinomadura craniellae]RAY13550.1 hypothetical protein DPM19_20690 [Actinomadura craniellae]
MRFSQASTRDGAPAQIMGVVDFSDGSGPTRVVAHAERELPPGGIPAYLEARRSGARSFVLWADVYRKERVATLVTQSAAGGVAVFQVFGTHGELIGTLVREKALRGRGLRTRWTVSQPGGPEAVGFKGRIVWWCLWWLSLPMQVLILLVTIFDSIPGNEAGVMRPPRRIRWRARGRLLLEFRSKGSKLHLHAPELDWRLGAALIVLLRTFGATSWDSGKK